MQPDAMTVHFADDVPRWRWRLHRWVVLRLGRLLGATVSAAANDT